MVDGPSSPLRAPTRAGCGATGYARLAVEVLDRLAVTSVVLVGDDCGGVIAQLVLTFQPERVAAAVLAVCDAFECFAPGVYRHLFRVATIPGVFRPRGRVMAWQPGARSRFGFGAVITRFGFGAVINRVGLSAHDPLCEPQDRTDRARGLVESER